MARIFIDISDDVILDLACEIQKTAEEKQDEQIRREIRNLTRKVPIESIFKRGA
jgi:hypothetical protein